MFSDFFAELENIINAFPLSFLIKKQCIIRYGRKCSFSLFLDALLPHAIPRKTFFLRIRI